jgi:hypothetical protein
LPLAKVNPDIAGGQFSEFAVLEHFSQVLLSRADHFASKERRTKNRKRSRIRAAPRSRV